MRHVRHTPLPHRPGPARSGPGHRPAGCGRLLVRAIFLDSCGQHLRLWRPGICHPPCAVLAGLGRGLGDRRHPRRPDREPPEGDAAGRAVAGSWHPSDGGHAGPLDLRPCGSPADPDQQHHLRPGLRPGAACRDALPAGPAGWDHGGDPRALCRALRHRPAALVTGLRSRRRGHADLPGRTHPGSGDACRRPAALACRWQHPLGRPSQRP